ncbi:MAG: hypothetical protein SOX46_07095 [Clostridiaceae bacterium]|nr:hypothetical protein [Clostridium sp.]MCI6140799.1 hypothetical protein [Clostridium sp.]MDY3231325.1 hypothetical protein [Clostridiaceae bacterium]
MMIMAIADEQTKDTDALGAEGYIFRRQKAEKGTDKREVKGGIPVLIMEDMQDSLKNYGSVSGIIYGGILGRLADSYAWDAAESILKLNA